MVCGNSPYRSLVYKYGFVSSRLNYLIKKLNKPSWQPPEVLIPIVWTGLYTNMGYASFLILRDGVGEQRNLALGLYGSQLLLNWIWTPIFFHYHNIGLVRFEKTECRKYRWRLAVSLI